MFIKASIQNVTHTVIRGISATRYLVFTSDPMVNCKEFIAWNPAYKDQYQNGRTASILYETNRKGEVFYNQTAIRFDAHEVHDRQLTLPGILD